MMNDEVDRWMGNPYLETLAFFSIAVLALIVFLAIFELVTKYKDWDEIKNGNLSVAMATGERSSAFATCFVLPY
ncbi:DUF350 domain-containing protein [Paenibacillus sp. P26]|nr:DUF350 domain-containing protein [Paenibacillus sp. P26]UUZ92959.1 DUF350 domain-containing protein [Paenibacillus sp. P25]